MSGVKAPGVSIEPLASDAEAENRFREIYDIRKCLSLVAECLAGCGYQVSAGMLRVQMMRLLALENAAWKQIRPH